MKKLIMCCMVAVATGVLAEEKTSFLGTLCSAAENSDAATEAAVKADSGIAKLSQQIKDLKAKIDEAKNMPNDKLDELKKQYEALKAKLVAKLEEYKSKQAKTTEEEQKKAEERKAKLEQVKKDGKGLVDSIKSLFD